MPFRLDETLADATFDSKKLFCLNARLVARPLAPIAPLRSKMDPQMDPKCFPKGPKCHPEAPNGDPNGFSGAQWGLGGASVEPTGASNPQTSKICLRARVLTEIKCKIAMQKIMLKSMVFVKVVAESTSRDLLGL